jgi:hypothetical protein
MKLTLAAAIALLIVGGFLLVNGLGPGSDRRISADHFMSAPPARSSGLGTAGDADDRGRAYQPEPVDQVRRDPVVDRSNTRKDVMPPPPDANPWMNPGGPQDGRSLMNPGRTRADNPWMNP